MPSIDDIISVDDTFGSCLLAVIKTIKLFQCLGFVIYAEKNTFIPSKKVEYVGLVIDSERMVTYLPDHKRKRCMINVSQFQKARFEN